MRKKLLFSLVLGFGILVSNTGCGDRSKATEDGPPIVALAADNASDSSAPAVKTEYGPNVNQQEADTIVNKITSRFPRVTVNKIQRAPVDGFYQVIAGGDILYVSADGNNMFVGDLLSMAGPTQVNLTEEVRKESRLSVMKELSEDDMVVYEPKSGKADYTVTVFTDIDCGYCRKFHKELDTYLDKNIKVRYLSFPRAGVGSNSYNKARTVWCAKDRNKAMNDAKLGNDFKADEKLCSNDSVDKALGLVRKLGLNGTPALLFEDGTLLPGYMPADALKAALDNLKERQQAQTSMAPTAG